MDTEEIPDWRAPGFEELTAVMLSVADRPVYVIGGAVRDFLVKRGDKLADLDLALAPPVMDVARRVADQIGWAFYPLDAERDVARLVNTDDGLVCDVAALRGSLYEDLLTRDFPINAIALELSNDAAPQRIDPTGGVDDLRRGRLRVADPANLDADPVRLLRAVRMVHKFELTPTPDLVDAIRQRASHVTETSQERIRDELWKIMALSRPERAMQTLSDWDLLPGLFPELDACRHVTQSPPHHLDVFEHTLLVMAHAAALRDWLTDRDERLASEVATCLTPFRPWLQEHFGEVLASERSRADWLPWHGLVHDWGKPSTRTEESTDDGEVRIRFFGHEEISRALAKERLTFLRFGRKEIALSETVAQSHMRPHHLHASFPGGSVSRRAAYRFFRDTASGPAGENSGLDVLLLALADVQATGAERPADWPGYLQMVTQLLSFAQEQSIDNAPPLLNGGALIHHLGIKPGPQIGRLLEAIAEAQASEEIKTEEEALALARKLIARKQ